MRKSWVFFTAAAILALHQALEGQGVSKSGTIAAKFLSIDAGARAVAMGGAFASVADDATAMFWNPAGIAGIRGTEFLVTYGRWLADIRTNYTGLVLPAGNLGTLGVNATFVTMDDMERTTVEAPDGTGEYFDAGSLAFGISVGRALTDRFSIGFNGKYIRESIYHSRAQGLALDIGTLFRTQFHDMRIGMSISNFGTKMRMTGDDMLVQHDIDPVQSGNNGNIKADLRTDAFDLPLMFRVGVSADLLKSAGGDRLIVALDALHPNDSTECVNAGCEYVFRNRVRLRVGYKSLFSRDSQQGLTLGGGLTQRIGGTGNISIDYAYQDFGILNNTQRFSLAIRL
ncbi:PorV/PorQ family protein [bacterium]|nr:PorV/PorQ family protein [bacterium]